MCLRLYASPQIDHAADLRLFMEALPYSTQRWFVIGLEPPEAEVRPASDYD